jgi:hypothetical protein
MNIEEFGVSDDCFESLNVAGVTQVNEIVSFLEAKQPGDTIGTAWAFHIEEILTRLKNLGLWSPRLEQL